MESDAKRRHWRMVHAERAALVEDLARLEPEQWDTPSLCAGWTVHDVAAHLVDTALTAPVPASWPGSSARGSTSTCRTGAGWSGGAGTRPRRRWPGCGGWCRGRRRRRPRSTPGLVEEVVHGEDIRRVVGLERVYPQEAVVRALRL
ncbi:maleylpyruvate isomerase family mycothiol-dependent enzyme [Streptomyces californicus]